MLVSLRCDAFPGLEGFSTAWRGGVTFHFISCLLSSRHCSSTYDRWLAPTAFRIMEGSSLWEVTLVLL